MGKDEHTAETYKSLIQISLEGFRLLTLLNGGAAVALLTYLGNSAAKGIALPDMRLPMGCYLAGLVFCACTLLFSYWTQFALFNESMRTLPIGRHMVWQRIATASAVLSLIAFGTGSWIAVSALGSLSRPPVVVGAEPAAPLAAGDVGRADHKRP